MLFYTLTAFQEVDQLAKMIIKNDSISVDIKVIAECYQASSMATFCGQLCWTTVQKCFGQGITNGMYINGLLLQGRVLRHYATLLCRRGEYKRAQECIRGAKQKLFNAAPSFERASVGYTAATWQQTEGHTTRSKGSRKGLWSSSLLYGFCWRTCKTWTLYMPNTKSNISFEVLQNKREASTWRMQTKFGRHA